MRNGDCHNFGNDALKDRSEVTLSHPIQGGIIQNWEDTEGLLSHAMGRLTDESNTPPESKLLVTEPAFNPVKTKKKTLELLIESMGFDNVSIVNQSILVLYAHGLLSGLVVDCGEGTTQIVPVYEGYAPQHLVKRHPVTGNLITKYLSSLLQIGSNSKFTHDMVTVKDIKEKMCYVAQDLKQDRRLVRETTVLVENYILPDGTAVKVGREKFECTEAYFDPSLVDVECVGLSDFIFDTIQECDVSIRRNIYEHIILSGGSSMFPGMPNRIQKEIRQKYFKDILKEDQNRVNKCKIRIEAPSHREYTSFVGGSILSELMSGDSTDFWITKAKYQEDGVERLV